MIDKIFELKNKDLQITKVGFIEEKELEEKRDSQFGVYPIFKIHISSEEELKELLNSVKIEEYLYDITLNDLKVYIESMEGFNEFLKERYLNSIQLFREGVDIWLNSIFDKLHYSIIQQTENDITFYKY